MADECIRCNEAPAVHDGLCGHCIWKFRDEVEGGFYQLRQYLRHVDEFRVWCREHGQPEP